VIEKFWWAPGIYPGQNKTEGKRGSGKSTCGQVRFLFGSSSKGGFSITYFYTSDKSFADFGEVGLSQILCVDWLLT